MDLFSHVDHMTSDARNISVARDGNILDAGSSGIRAATDPPDVDHHAAATVPPTTTDLFRTADDTPLVAARSDSELARAFLQANALSAHSIKSLTKDLGRFLLWCQENRTSLLQLRIEDLIAYKQFLADPRPAEHWISATKWPRDDPRWRPFSGPLSTVSINHAFRVVKALLSFAKDAGYLQRNAGALVKNVQATRTARVTRYLEPAAMIFVEAAIEAMPARTSTARRAQARDRFLFMAYATTGARLSELTGATMGAVYAEADRRWWLDVLGKGNKERRLPVSLALLAAFRRYRAQYGLAPETMRDDTLPLVLATRGTGMTGVTDEAVSRALKSLFAAGAMLADAAGNANAALSLRQASAHWLRHTMLTTHANNAVSLKVLQDTAGHASIATTALYLHKSDTERHDELLASLEQIKAADATVDVDARAGGNIDYAKRR